MPRLDRSGDFLDLGEDLELSCVGGGPVGVQGK